MSMEKAKKAKKKNTAKQRASEEEMVLAEIKKVEREIKNGDVTGKEKDRLADTLSKIGEQIDELNDEEKLSDFTSESLKNEIKRVTELLDIEDKKEDRDEEAKDDEKEAREVEIKIRKIEGKIQRERVSAENKDELSDELEKIGDEIEDLNDAEKLSDKTAKSLKEEIGRLENMLDVEDEDTDTND